MLLGLTPDAKSPEQSGPSEGSAFIVDGNAANFVKEVVEGSQEIPVIVQFWSERCGPCKQLKPLLERAVAGRKGKVKLVRVDVDSEREIAAQMRVQAVPTLFAFFQGQPVDAAQGALPESQIKAFLDKLIKLTGDESEDTDAILEEGEAAFRAGDFALARQVFQSLLTRDAEDPKALSGLLRCFLKERQTDQVEQILNSLSDSLRRNEAIQQVETQLGLMKNSAAKVGELESLQRRLETHPEDCQTRFELAQVQMGLGLEPEAIDQLLAVIKRDREFQEGAAHQKLLEFFQVLGHSHPLVVSGRRKLSSLLFS